MRIVFSSDSGSRNVDRQTKREREKNICGAAHSLLVLLFSNLCKDFNRKFRTP